MLFPWAFFSNAFLKAVLTEKKKLKSCQLE